MIFFNIAIYVYFGDFGSLSIEGFSVFGKVGCELRLVMILYGSRDILDSPTLNSLGLKTISSTGRVLKSASELDLRIFDYFMLRCEFEFIFELSML